MKKVIGVAVAASLVAGMAFADVAVSLNARMRADMYNQTKQADGDKTTTTLDLDKYGAMADTLAVKGSTDFAGVVLEATIDGTASELNASENKSKDFAIDNYYGWVNWGALKVTAGIYDSRYMNRYNTTSVENGLTDSDTAKYGISNLLTTSVGASNKPATTGKTFGYDFNNISQLAGGNKMSFLADYTINDLPGTLLLKAGLIENTYKSDTTDATDEKYQESGFAFEADYKQKDAINLQAIVKMPTEDQMGFGIYLEPLMIPNANVVAGFTYAKDDTDGAKATAWAVDGRLVYKLSDAMKAVAQAKYTSIDIDGADTETGLELVGSVQYTVNDLIVAQFDAGYYNCDMDDNDKTDGADQYIKIRPAVKLVAGKNAGITVGFEYQKALNADDGTTGYAAGTDTQIKLPVIFRVKL